MTPFAIRTPSTVINAPPLRLISAHIKSLDGGIVKLFESYVELIRANQLLVPDHVRREIDEYNEVAGSLSQNFLPTGPNHLIDTQLSSTGNVDDHDVEVHLEMNTLMNTATNEGVKPLDNDNVRVV